MAGSVSIRAPAMLLTVRSGPLGRAGTIFCTCDAEHGQGQPGGGLRKSRIARFPSVTRRQARSSSCVTEWVFIVKRPSLAEKYRNRRGFCAYKR